MRTVAGGNAAQPTGSLTDFTGNVKIEVANASDALVDLTTYAVSLEYDQTTDEIVDGATVVFRRLEGVNSLAPLMTASPPVNLGRRIVISINAGSGTYKEIFRGKIDSVDWPERFGDVTVQCRDQAGVAADTWIETARQYGSTTGVSLETVMQAVADNNLTTSYTLNFPAATSAVVQHVAGDPPYGPTEQSTLDALRALAESIGWTIRWRHFDASASDWKWTVFQPSRTKTVADHTFGTSTYWDVTTISQSIEDIRNAVTVEYTGAGEARSSVTVTDSVSTGGAMTASSTTLTVTAGNTFAATDVGKSIRVPGAGAAGVTLSTTIATRVSATEVTLAAAASTTVSGKSVEWGSIAKYGRRFMKISEGSDSPVNNSTLATALANAALSDLKEPDAILEITCRYFWPGEVGVDLYTFTANNKHFSSDQTLAAMAFHHRIAVGEKPTTKILCRGKPSGGVLMWQRRAGSSDVPEIRVSNFREVARSETEVTVGWDVAGAIEEIWLYTSTPTQPVATDPWSVLTGVPTVRLTGATTSYVIPIPAPGLITYGRLVPIGPAAVRGTSWDFTIQGAAVSLIQRATIVSTSTTQIVVRVAVANPITGTDVSIAYAAGGLTVSPASGQTIFAASVTSDLATTGYVDFTITRPAFIAGTGRVTFTASSTDRTSDVDAVDVPAQEQNNPGAITLETSGADVIIDLNGPSTCVSWRYAVSTSAIPSDGSADSGTINNNRVARITAANVVPNLGDRYYVKARQYDATNGTGNGGPYITAEVERQNKSTTKTIRVGAHLFLPAVNSTQWVRGDHSLAGVVTTSQIHYASLYLPTGTLLTGFRIRGGPNTGDVVTAVLGKSNESGVFSTTLATKTITGNDTMQTTSTTSLSETLDGSSYGIKLTIDDTGGTPGPRLAEFLYGEVDYTADNLVKTV